jgi:hypothetical protein
MTTNTLWDLARLARNKDPDSSHIAADEVQAGGRHAAQCEAVYQAVAQHPGCTSAELGRIMGIDRHIPGRRLADLEHQGRVHKGDMRPCTVALTAAGRGRMAVTWWIGPQRPSCATE